METSLRASLRLPEGFQGASLRLPQGFLGASLRLPLDLLKTGQAQLSTQGSSVSLRTGSALAKNDFWECITGMLALSLAKGGSQMKEEWSHKFPSVTNDQKLKCVTP
jgi:hypothetical protein